MYNFFVYRRNLPECKLNFFFKYKTITTLNQYKALYLLFEGYCIDNYDFDSGKICLH